MSKLFIIVKIAFTILCIIQLLAFAAFVVYHAVKIGVESFFYNILAETIFPILGIIVIWLSRPGEDKGTMRGSVIRFCMFLYTIWGLFSCIGHVIIILMKLDIIPVAMNDTRKYLIGDIITLDSQESKVVVALEGVIAGLSVST